MQKGITKEKIVDAAMQLIAENGMDQFSMHALAEKLNVKPASLYSHIAGMEEVITCASGRILQEYCEKQMNAVRGKKGKEAFLSLALAEREYAEKNPAFYELIMNLQLSDNEALKKEAASIVRPVQSVLDAYALTSEQKTDAERAFRALVYGFISQEKHGYFTHFRRSTRKSFLSAVNAFAEEIEAKADEK